MFDFHNHLFVVRHALTPQNVKNLCLGWTDNLPSEESIQKRVDQTCNWLNGNNINQIISSNLPRTQVTAKRIAITRRI